MASRLGIHQSSLSRIESGLARPRKKLWTRIETLLAEFDVAEEETIDRIASEIAKSAEFRTFLIRVFKEIDNA